MANGLAARVKMSAEKKESPAEAGTLTEAIEKMSPHFALAMPRGMEATQLVRDALTALRTTKRLAECDRMTILGGLMTCAQLGLRVGVLGQAWLTPFWSKSANSFQAQLVIGYQGLVELAFRSDRIASISARTVHANDEFDLSYGAETDTFVHRPALDGPRGEARLYYAVARMKGGGYAITDPMTVADMERHRDKNATSRTREGKIFGPWLDHPEAMAHKTMVRKLTKLLPKSTELALAIEADERVRIDLTPDADGPLRSTRPDTVDGDVVEGDEASGGPA